MGLRKKKWDRIVTTTLVLFLVCFCSYAQDLVFQGPLNITKGGTYVGNYQSLDSKVSAITVNTLEPVVIEDCVIRSAGHMIWVRTGTNVIIRNNKGYGLVPSADGYSYGRFVNARLPNNLVIENNYFENTGGILVHEFKGRGTSNETIKILRNKVKNINGKFRNGIDYHRKHFVQFNMVNQVGNIEIAWNEVINEPGLSFVEDNVNIYNSSGKMGSPIKIHNNFIKGGYAIDPKTAWYTGGGIITDGRGVGTAACAYINAYENVIINNKNYGMGIASGNNIHYYNNRIISSALFPDGSRFVGGSGNGVWMRNYYDLPSTDWHSNTTGNNVIGWVCWGKNIVGQPKDRQDISVPAATCEGCNPNTLLPNPITLDIEEKEYQDWLGRCKDKSVAIGVLVKTSVIVLPKASEPEPDPVPPLEGTITGGGDGERVKKLKVYPNPSTTHIDIEFPATVIGEFEVEVKDLTGRTLLKHIGSDQGKTRVNFSSKKIKTGVYILNIRYENNNKSFKIIKIGL